MYQLKSKDSFIPPFKLIESFHYPGYVNRIQKERQKQKIQNLHESGVPAK